MIRAGKAVQNRLLPLGKLGLKLPCDRRLLIDQIPFFRRIGFEIEELASWSVGFRRIVDDQLEFAVDDRADRRSRPK